MAISKARLATCVRDAVGLITIAVVLAVIHVFTPVSLRQTLVFDHGQFRGYTLLTAAYVHASDVHLIQNLEGYFRIVGFPYVFSLVSHKRRWFWRTTLTLLFVLPVLTSVTSYALLPVLYPDVTPITYGFSDLVAGFAGFLIVAVGRYTQARYGNTAAWAVSIVTGCFVLILLGVRLTGAGAVIVTGSVGVASVLVGGWFLLQPHSQSNDSIRVEWTREAVILGVTTVILGALLWDLFPPLVALDASGPTTNLVGHAAGLGWGFVLAAGVLVLERL